MRLQVLPVIALFDLCNRRRIKVLSLPANRFRHGKIDRNEIWTVNHRGIAINTFVNLKNDPYLLYPLKNANVHRRRFNFSFPIFSQYRSTYD